ncbi:alpha/beta fold hydrolase [Brachybacterium sacelli]|uniref:Pimeloyl-ACP methyl ester carboxylesterase n=1 Tax=Brachybacterium sacelli TaxID=173364 RepID=A0ABS4WVY1_9MICO|nr:alpha/beta hydrolase [Brachybacterium sacelli]MBP2380361.1 pimeloyl-ACP methyl ester carboxylesterase [Brachybacterium sacelli]
MSRPEPASTTCLPDPVPVALDGVEIATYTLAPARAEPRGDVVLCHGTPWSAQVWDPVATALSEGYRVHLWDMPGYGLSAKGADVPVDLASQSGRLARLLEHWDLERPHVLAHDIGGAVALGAHLLHGREFASLMLWDVVTLDPWGSPFFRLVAEHADVFSALPPALHAALAREYITGAAHRELSTDQLEVLVAPWIAGEGQSAFYAQIAALTPEHTRPLVSMLGTVRCATAIGWGEQDPWIPVEQAAQLRERLPGDPPVTVLAATGHLAPLESPTEVSEAVEDWLEASRGAWAGEGRDPRG